VRARQPAGSPPPPVVARIRLRYAKRGRLRFASHRDLARAFERALRRAGVPMAYSAGFTPHPKISYAGAAPTGVASEAEYLEIGLQAPAADLNELRERLGAALPEGVDVLEAVEASAGGLADRLEASLWRVEFANDAVSDLQPLVDGLLARKQLSVDRLTRDGRRTVDVRGAILSATADVPPKGGHAIMEAVVRQVTPTVRPDDIVAALRLVAGLAPDAPQWTYQATRVAQGPLDKTGGVGDPLAADRSRRATS
jgi:radical SAM-linked protein